MISENTAKLIRSLTQKKYRYKHNLFIAEGKKLVFDLLLSGFKGIKTIFLTEDIFQEKKELLSRYSSYFEICTERDFSKVSNLNSKPEIILIGEIPLFVMPSHDFLSKGLHLFLDQIQDPGNVGTILRSAEWFGVQSVGFSEGTADFVHPRVIQASMGSFYRVPVWNKALDKELIKNIPVFGADTNGESIYTMDLPVNAILIIGSEGQGLSAESELLLTQFIKIPRYSDKTESLNAAVAASVLLGEWKRRTN